MILERETYKEFGYYPKDLKEKSSKLILVACDECGKIRAVHKYAYRKLCMSCAMKGKYPSSETRQKLSRWQKGKKLSETHKKNLSKARKGKCAGEKNHFYGKQHSIETKEKMSEHHRDVRKENNPNWQGGKRYEPYCILFNEEFKERVRNFLNRKCYLCDKTEEENKEKLSVHHVNYDKMVCCNNVKPLFVALCRSCHTKTHTNRNEWEEFFTTSLMKKYNGKCFYTKDEWDEHKKGLFRYIG